MLGYSEMLEVMLWVQTNAAAEVQFAYWPQGKTTERHLTQPYLTQHQEGYTARLIADEVAPGVRYDYSLLINGQPVKMAYPTTFQTQALWQWRTDPPPFTVALGSCNYISEEAYDRPGTPYGAGYGIFNKINEKRPDAMLWLGDNTYLREVDWNSWTGILHRYTHTRSAPEMQPLLASTHHYAIWDDHDFGPNNSDRSFVHKEQTLEAFRLFWGNPTYGVNRQPGITSAFQWADMDFFLIDNRYNRRPNDRRSGEAILLGENQLEWLIDALVSSQAPFKFIAMGGQVLNTAPVFENYVNLAPAERAYLLARIEEEGLTGVVFLTGDRHHSELSSYVNASGHTVYDLTVSPLTAGVAATRGEANELQVAGTLVEARNFGLLSFSGPRKARQMLIQLFDEQGVELWQRTVMAPTAK